MGRSRRFRWIAVPLAALALLAAGCGDDDSGDDDAAPSEEETETSVPDGIVVGAGINDPEDATIAVLEFLPEDITIEAGTAVTWEWNGGEPHSVTFVPEGQAAPNVEEDPNAAAAVPPTGPIDGTEYVSSALQPLGAAPEPFEAEFATPGEFPYICIIHPNMTGVVTVVEAGAEADSPADVAEAREASTEEYLEEGRGMKADLVDAEPVQAENADGSTTWTIEMGVTSDHVDVLAFAPTPAGVQAGDTVTFVNNTWAPHTASFFGEGAEIIQSPFDPRAQAPAPGPSPQALAAAGYFNTGLLPPDFPPGEGPPVEVRSFSFTIPTAGSYPYVCIFHAPSEMVGVIEAT